MPVGLGVDIVEIDRMKRIVQRSPAFVRKVFTEDEQAYCNSKANPATHYAARFAAKEAVCKALGTGILVDGIGMHDVEVVRDFRGRPAVELYGAAKRIASEQGVLEIPLSLSYTHDVAVANAVAITKESQVESEKRRDVKAELAQQFKQARTMLDDLGEATAQGATASHEGNSDDSQAGGAQPLHKSATESATSPDIAAVDEGSDAADEHYEGAD